jgi:hypothetical protein
MNITANSPLGTRMDQPCNTDDFDPQLFWTDNTNKTLHYLVASYDHKIGLYKVLTTGILNGYFESSKYNYRFNFENYIRIGREKSPTISYANSDYRFYTDFQDTQQFSESVRNNNILLIIHTSDVMKAAPDLFFVNDLSYSSDGDGDIYGRDGMRDDIGSLITDLIEYNFLDTNQFKHFHNGTEIYRNSYTPMSTIPYDEDDGFQYIQEDYVGKNLWAYSGITYTSFANFGTGSKVMTNPNPDNSSIRIATYPWIYSPYGFYLLGVPTNPQNYLTKNKLNFSLPIEIGAKPITISFWYLCLSDEESGFSIQVNGDIIGTMVERFIWRRATLTTTVNANAIDISIMTSETSILFIKYFKVEEGSVATPFVDSFRDFNFWAYDKNDYPICNLDPFSTGSWSQIYYNAFLKIDIDAKKVFIENKYYDVTDMPCNFNEWYYYSMDGSFKRFFTKGNVHEAEVVDKEFVVVNDKKLPIKITTAKQLKVNTGFGTDESLIRDLIKTPYVFRPEYPSFDLTGRNLLLNTAAVRSGTGTLDYGTFANAIGKGGFEQTYLGADYYTPYVLSFEARLVNITGFPRTYIYIEKTWTSGLNFVAGPVTDTDKLAQTFKKFTFVIYNVWCSDIGKSAADSRLLFQTYQDDAYVDATFEIKNVKLEKGTVATDYTPAPEDTDPDYDKIKLKQYQINTNSFDGFNGSKYSETNLELILEDTKKYKRRTTVNQNFWD